jgi:hypothetical protein
MILAKIVVELIRERSEETVAIGRHVQDTSRTVTGGFYGLSQLFVIVSRRVCGASPIFLLVVSSTTSTTLDVRRRRRIRLSALVITIYFVVSATTFAVRLLLIGRSAFAHSHS